MVHAIRCTIWRCCFCHCCRRHSRCCWLKWLDFVVVVLLLLLLLLAVMVLVVGFFGLFCFCCWFSLRASCTHKRIRLKNGSKSPIKLSGRAICSTNYIDSKFCSSISILAVNWDIKFTWPKKRGKNNKQKHTHVEEKFVEITTRAHTT